MWRRNLILAASLFGASLSAPLHAIEFKDCTQWLKSLRQKSQSFGEYRQLLFGSALRKIPAQSFEIIAGSRDHPNIEIPTATSNILEQEKSLRLYNRFQRLPSILKSLNFVRAIKYRSQAQDPKRSGWKKLYSAWRFFLPMAPSYVRWKTNRIYAQVQKNPAFLLSDSDQAFIKKWNLASDLERYRKEAQVYSRSFNALSIARKMTHALKWTAVGAALILSLSYNNYISAQSSFNENSPAGMSRYDEKVELIFTSPMPHASVRMGGLVYNYGVFHVDRYNLDEFQKMVGFGKDFSGSHTRIELKLTDFEKARLREALEADVAKVYPLMVPFVDCVSESNKAVGKACPALKVPPVANRSQALSIAYLKSLKLLGSDKVGTIYFAAGEDSTALAKSKDLFVNAMDTMLFAEYAVPTFIGGELWDRFGQTNEVKYQK